MAANSLADKLATFAGHRQPRVVGQFNGHDLLIEPAGTPNTGGPATAEPHRLV